MRVPRKQIQQKRITTYVYLASSAVFLGAAAVLFKVLYVQHGRPYQLSLYITFLTTFYHFAMRLAVGICISVCFRNRDFHNSSWWYQEKPFEEKLYKYLKIKRWKNRVITAMPELFDVKSRSTDELIHNITQAEVVHETIIVLSFAPMCLIPKYGATGVFTVTSVAAALCDSIFVMIQRYNRPRLLRIKSKISR